MNSSILDLPGDVHAELSVTISAPTGIHTPHLMIHKLSSH
jgi:hypothetical protein